MHPTGTSLSAAQEVPMLTRLGWFTVRRRRLVLSFTALFMVVAAVVGASAFGVLQGGGFDDPSSESATAEALLEQRFGGGDPNLVLVGGGASVDGAEQVAAGTDIAARLDSIGDVEQVVSYWSLGSPESLRSTDGDTALVLASVTGDEALVEQRIELIQAELAGDQGVFDVMLGGREAVLADVGSTIEGDLLRAELIAVPLTLLLLLLLLFVFRGVVAASLPLLVGIIAVLGTLLSLFVIGSVTDVSIYAINLTTALGLGLAIDYSLFIVSRFREELQSGRTVEHAVVRTVETAGKTVLISALTVAVSLSALLVFPLYFLRSFAYAGVGVVLLALAGSLLSLPALLAVLGHRVNALRIGRRRERRADHEGMWHRIAMFVMRCPVPIAATVVAVLLLLGTPFLRVNFGTPDDRVLPPSAGSRQASEILRSDFTGNSAESFGVVAEGAGADRIDDIAASAARISAMDGVDRVDSAAGTFVDGDLVATDDTDDTDRRFLAPADPSATFGAKVWIFQDGNLSGVLGFTATGAIDASMPILMFCIAFGLSMDYEVFLLSRIKEEHDRTGDNGASVALGLERTGSIVTAAAALLAITFFAFGTSGVSFIKMFGIGLGLAVLMDATVVRAFLVPAFMRLAGEANWWAPGPLRRFHDRYGLKESDGADQVGLGSDDDRPERELVGAGR